MSTLRNRLIRLAHTNPELRADILPLLNDGAESVRGVQASRGTPTLADLEAALRKARREVFDDNQVIADAASLEIKRLRKLIEAHPDEVSRRDKVRQDQDERLMRRWE